MTKQIYLLPVEKEDLDFMLKMRKNPDIMEFWFGEPYMTKEKLTKFYDDSQKDDTIRQFIAYSDDQKIGYTSLFRISLRHRTAVFGIMIDADHQGKGYAEHIVHEVVKYAFYQLNLNKVTLDVVDYNEKAIHIYEKVGFKIEGRKEQQYMIKGNYHTGYAMGILKADYEKSNKY